MALTGAGLDSMRAIPTFGTVGAIAEIVDNSIQATDKKGVDISIVFIERNKSIDEILIVDNGLGFGKDSNGNEVIDYCLAFGGGTRHNAKSGLGKFGVGLPYACCNQSEDYHVYSWQEPNKIKHIFRRHKDFAADQIVVDAPHSIEESLPKHFEEILPRLSSYSSGSIVQWKNCDNLTYVNAKTIINHLERKIGRIYRYYIDNGVNIEFVSCKHPENSKPVLLQDLCRKIKKLDPLFLEKNTALPPPYDMNPSSELFGEKYEHEYEDSKGNLHKFLITCSVADKEQPIQFTVDGKAGGSTPIGKEYAKVKGISLVRANREIRLHHFGHNFRNGYSDPRHRWYKIEVRFDPMSDKLLGLNANKTDAVHFKNIDDIQAMSVEEDHIKLRLELAAKLNDRLGSLWDELQKRVQENKSKNNPKAQKCPKCNQKTLINGTCNNQECGVIFKVCPEHQISFDVTGSCPACQNVITPNICTRHKTELDEHGKCPSCEELIPIDLNADEKEELGGILKAYSEFEDHDLDMFMDWFVSCNKKHIPIFVTDKLNPNSLLQYSEIQGGKVYVILINKIHPYFEHNISPLLNMDDDAGFNKKALESIILFFITWVDAETSSTSDKASIKRFRTKFGLNLDEVLQQWQMSN